MSESFSSSDLAGDRLVQLANDCRDPAKREQAAATLWALLNDVLVSRLTMRIADHLQGKVSAESVLQDAWMSFFRRQQTSPYDFRDGNDVRGLLFTMARNKLINRVRALNTKKRKPHFGDTGKSDDGGGGLSGDSDLLNAEPAEWTNAESGALAAGHLISEPQKLKRGYTKESDEFPPIQEIAGLIADTGTGWLDELLQGADPLAAEVVKEKVEPLDDDLKTVLRLRYVEGHSLEQTADIMGVTFRAVRYKMAAIEEAFLDLENDSTFGPAAHKQRPRKSP